jgi:hypothetical protein
MLLPPLQQNGSSTWVPTPSMRIQQYTPTRSRIFGVTPWSRVLHEQLTGLQLVKKFLAFCGTRSFITAFTSARHLSLSWASSIQSVQPHLTSWRSALILSSHLCPGLLRGLFPSDFPTKTLYTTHPSPYALHIPPISFFSIPRLSEYFVTKIRFRGEELIASRPTSKLEDHPLSAVRDCLFNIFVPTLRTGRRSSVRNLRTRHAVRTAMTRHQQIKLVNPVHWGLLLYSDKTLVVHIAGYSSLVVQLIACSVLTARLVAVPRLAFITVDRAILCRPLQV